MDYASGKLILGACETWNGRALNLVNAICASTEDAKIQMVDANLDNDVNYCNLFLKLNWVNYTGTELLALSCL